MVGVHFMYFVHIPSISTHVVVLIIVVAMETINVKGRNMSTFHGFLRLSWIKFSHSHRGFIHNINVIVYLFTL